MSTTPDWRAAHPINPELFAHNIAHWKRQAREAQAQITAGTYPQYDANSRRYIAECRRIIRGLHERYGVRP